MDLTKMSKGFLALGSEQRLAVYTTLVANSPEGLSMKQIQETLDIKPSTLAHHIKFLVEANFIRQERHGKETLNYANLDELETLCHAIMDSCCSLSSDQDDKK